MGFLKISLRSHRAVIAGKLVDARTEEPIEGALVVISSMPAAVRALLDRKAMSATCTSPPDQARTAPDGVFHFAELPDATYTLSFSLPGGTSRYGTVDQNFTVQRDADGNVPLSIVKVSLPPTALSGIIAGKVSGSSTTTPLSLARIVVRGTGEKAYGDADGRFYLTGVETGTRTLEVRASGYGVTLATAAVVAGQITDIGTIVLS